MDADVSKYFETTNHGAVMRVRKESDMLLWLNSKAYHEVISYINRTSMAIQGIQQLDPHGYPVSSVIRKLCNLIDSLIKQLRTFKTNTMDAYRSWSHQVLHNIFQMLESALPSSKCTHVFELGQYLAGAFGSFVRADYGTGNELSFLFFLCGLFQAGILRSEDEPAAALMLFGRYLKCVRRMQIMFELKPSANQGAYSLDEYQFVAYMWGAAQLSYEPPFSPKELLDKATIDQWQHQYLIVGCVAFLASSKPGSFAMHSNQLWSIASLSSWPHLYTGLHIMYLKEVVAQFYTLRELCFGQLMLFEPVPPASQLLRAKLGHLTMARQRYLAKLQKSNEKVQVQVQLQDKRELKPEDSSKTLQLPSIINMSTSVLSGGKSVTSFSGSRVHLRPLSKKMDSKQQRQYEQVDE